MKMLLRTLGAWLVLTMPVMSHAVIMDFKQLDIDFSKFADATNQATWGTSTTWPTPTALTVSNGGFGFDGNPAESHQGWIHTKPLALGLWWRPASAISIHVIVQPEPKEVIVGNGHKITPDAGDVYVRYSPDLMHWSSWQALLRKESQLLEDVKPGRHWNGTVRVPYRHREAYSKLVSDYSSLDVPWKSDEEATVKWILDREPDFFAKQLPFIGYVEFLFETGFHGGQRVQSFRAEINYGMSGLHSPPKDGVDFNERHSGQWQFKASAEPKSATNKINSANPK